MKDRLLEQVRRELTATLARLAAAAHEAHAAATDPGSKAESKYDTRSLEASYLAQGQARQAEDLAAALERLHRFEARDFELTERVACGALVETDLDGVSEWFLLLPAGGGHEIDWDDRTIILLAPESPLFQSLVGGAIGDPAGGGRTITEIS